MSHRVRHLMWKTVRKKCRLLREMNSTSGEVHWVTAVTSAAQRGDQFQPQSGNAEGHCCEMRPWNGTRGPSVPPLFFSGTCARGRSTSLEGAPKGNGTSTHGDSPPAPQLWVIAGSFLRTAELPPDRKQLGWGPNPTGPPHDLRRHHTQVVHKGSITPRDSS